ncbi:asparagine synthase-related protein [Rhodanobacter geophilus]|uniref:asparagine synthase (glutamine-hydrolyzing) n=1 Tax=Rhodanobacter geophilus TaxID=3162488 RepID=A0ABV3QTB3_9GAMM
MSYRYIALVDVNRRWNLANLTEIEAALQMDNMRERFTSGSIRLFLAAETPFQPLPGGGFAIGHLFSRTFAPFDAMARLSTFSSNKRLREHVTENCWGEYVLVQPDERDGTGITLTRDPSGGVPCIYSLRNGSGFITSGISLATRLDLYRKRIDWDVLIHCLTYPNLKTRRTAFADICELLPGSSLAIDPRNLTTHPNWSPWKFVARGHRHTNLVDAAADIRASVASVVHAWADVDESILMELSGGIDSSIVAACLKNAGPRVTCYNLATPVPGADERQYARQMAACLGVDLQTEQLDLDIACGDVAPFPDAVSPRMGILQYAVSHAMEAAALRHGASSTYTGSGGDTVFGLLTNAVPAADAIRERGVIAGLSSIRDLSVLHQCTMWKAARLTARKMIRAPKAACVPDCTFMNPSLFIAPAEAHPWFDAPKGMLPGDWERIVDLASNQLFRDIVYRGENCWIRMPLLSQPVVEACLRVPSWMSISGGHNRVAARAAFADVLPPDILNRRSKGSFVGYLGAVFKRNKNQIRETLLSGGLNDQHLLDADALTRFFEAELPPRDKSFTRVLSLFTAENWVRHQAC